MALDRQRILNELGSVVNQLQSADCGCMGKLFTDSNMCQGTAGMTAQPSAGMCRHSHCQNHANFNPGFGQAAPCATPYNTNMCMGQCNPPKLYADTYGFLNKNLMQPVVNEVYNDLKSITPENTIMNNSVGAKMGMPLGQSPELTDGMGAQNGMISDSMLNQPHNSMQSHMQQNMMHTNQNPMQSINQNQIPIENMVHSIQGGMPLKQGGDMGYQSMNNADMSQNQMHGSDMSNQVMPGQHKPNFGHAMGGMGPQIMKMMTSAKEAKCELGGQSFAPITPGGLNSIQTNDMNAGMHQAQLYNNAAINQKPNMDMDQGLNNAGIYNEKQTNNLHADAQPAMNGKMLQGQGDNNSLSNPIFSQRMHNRNYGHHTQGMTKFNEMFPGVTNGDLGFDPMSIALQMNPANHQKAAMEQMQKILNGDNTRARHMEPAIAGTNAALANMSQGQLSTAKQQLNTSQHDQQEFDSASTPQNHRPNMNTAIASNQQKLYDDNTASTFQGQQVQQTPEQKYQIQQQIESNTGAMPATTNDPPTYDGSLGNSNAQHKDAKPDTSIREPDYDKLIIKEPIFPAVNTSFQTPLYMKRPKFYDYNTLGQPVEKLPSKLYRPPSPEGLPQTLSPQPVTKLRNDYNERFGVKQTESKTSLVGIRPIGRNPSRSQMQHIYNKYKGSQSETEQRVKNPSIATYSERRLKVPPRNEHQMPQSQIEKVGGDTVANNNPGTVGEIYEKGYPPTAIEKGNVGDTQEIEDKRVERVGDVLSGKPFGDQNFSPPPKKSRNGLQDQKHTAYTGSYAWSFHGTPTAVPYSAGYNIRNRGYRM